MKVTLMVFGVLITHSIMAQLPTGHYSFKTDSTIVTTKINYQYKPFNFSLYRTTDFSNYPLTSAQIKQQESKKNLYKRTINTITNRNGLVGNIISLSGWELERYRPKP